MKKIIYIMCICVFILGMLSGCGGEFAGEMASGNDVSRAITGAAASGQAVSEQAIHADEKPAYVKAYTEFLLYADIDQGHDFPIRGYYLFDLNFDNIPELAISHDSGGSMGGYFTYYYFDGKEIKEILNEGEPARVSNYTQVLADFEQKKVYLLKEMYLLRGNQNGTYGYVSEIKSQGQCPYIYDILDLEVDEDRDLSSYCETEHECEDEFLSDLDLEDCLITRYYDVGKKWVEISSKEYLKKKRKLIPKKNSFVDLREESVGYFGVDDSGDDLYVDLKIGEKEIEQLFERYTNLLCQK